MTYPTKLSEKVTPQRLDTMYGNFVKITDWLIKGKQSQHTMPTPFGALFDAAELVQAQQATIVEQGNVIGGLQQRLAQQDGRITALENTLQAVNQTLTQLVEIANAQAQQQVPQGNFAPQTMNPVVAQHAHAQQPASVQQEQVTEELADLGAVTQPAQQPAPVQQQAVSPTNQGSQAELVRPASPNEQAIQVSAAAVGAGNIDPASYAALDAEIGALLS